MPTQSTNSTQGIVASSNEKWTINAGVMVSSSISDAFSAPQFNVNNVGLVNHGTLLSTHEGGHGVYIRGENSAITNSATGKITGVLAGIAANGLGATIDNKGIVPSDSQFGVLFSVFSADIALTNSGTIFGKSAGVEVLTFGDGGSITNSGLIDSDGRGIYVGAGAGPTIINNEAGGTIEGPTAAIFTSASFLYTNGSIRLTNLGKVVGNIDCDAVDEADTVINKGEIKGDVFLGSGNDEFNGKGGKSGKVFGEAGDDSLTGGNAADHLYGGLGNDELNGGKGKDAFVFDTALNAQTNVDRIKGFSVKDDTMWLDQSIFTALGKTGTLSSKSFVIGKKAKDKNDHILYDKKSGAVLYDEDGKGGVAAVKFAVLDDGLKLTNKDFIVIA